MAFIKPQWKILYDVLNIPTAQVIEPSYRFNLSFAVHYGVHPFLHLIFNISSPKLYVFKENLTQIFNKTFYLQTCWYFPDSHQNISLYLLINTNYFSAYKIKIYFLVQQGYLFYYSWLHESILFVEVLCFQSFYEDYWSN